MTTAAPNRPTTTPPAAGSSGSTDARDRKIESWRFAIVAIGFGLLTLLVVARLVKYQLWDEDSGIWSAQLPGSDSPRGVIVDANGELLAVDRFFVDISATPHELSAKDRVIVARLLSELAGLDAVEVQNGLAADPDAQYVLLAKGLDMKVGHEIEAYRRALEEAEKPDPLQSVHIRYNPERYYPQGSLASHILGIVGVDNADDSGRKGYYGTEGYYDSFLWHDGASLPGRTFQEVSDLPEEVRRFLPSASGNDIVLTIDRTLQWIIEEELVEALKKYEAQSGSIIVMEPKSGAIMAMANYPAYDPNKYAETEPSVLGNPTVSAQYEPGSIFKIITMAAALDTQQIKPTTIFTDTGAISLGQRLFLNSARNAVGRVDVSDALARSLNVVTVQIAAGLGDETFYRYIRRFGFGEPTEVDLSGEISGAVKWPYTKDWSLSDLGANSFGQGIAVTPLQMTSATAAIANGGLLMRPYVVQARTQGDKVLYTEPTILRRAISAQAAADMTEMMVNVVEKGAPAARIAGYKVAGKTGTAQIPTLEGYTEDETIVSFVGFAPADDPQFVMLIKLDRPNPDISPWASYTAAPAFAQTAKRLLEAMNIPPDEIRLAQARN